MSIDLFERLVLNEATPKKKDQPKFKIEEPDQPPDFTANDKYQMNPSLTDQPGMSDTNVEQSQDSGLQPPDGVEQTDDGSMPEGDPNQQELQPPDDGMEQQPGMGQPGNELDQLETDVFSVLKPDQMAVKIEELKMQYKKLNDVITDSLERINKISRTTYDNSMIDFIVRKLLDLKDLSRDALLKTFKTRTYVENQIEFQKLLMAYNMIANLLSEIYESRIKRKSQYDKSNNKKSNNNLSFSKDINLQ